MRRLRLPSVGHVRARQHRGDDGLLQRERCARGRLPPPHGDPRLHVTYRLWLSHGRWEPLPGQQHRLRDRGGQLPGERGAVSRGRVRSVDRLLRRRARLRPVRLEQLGLGARRIDPHGRVRTGPVHGLRPHHAPLVWRGADLWVRRYINGSSLTVPIGVYPITTNPCTGDHLVRWTVTGGVSVTGTNLYVNSSGSVGALYQPVPPSIVITVANSSFAGDPVLVSATVGVPVPPFNYNYTWSFHDGSSPVTTPVNFTSHTFADPGRYNVSVVVVDPINRTANASSFILIVAGSPLSSSLLTPLSLAAIALVVIVAISRSRSSSTVGAPGSRTMRRRRRRRSPRATRWNPFQARRRPVLRRERSRNHDKPPRNHVDDEHAIPQRPSAPRIFAGPPWPSWSFWSPYWPYRSVVLSRSPAWARTLRWPHRWGSPTRRSLRPPWRPRRAR